MKTNQLILGLVLIVVVGGGSFYAGMKYQQGKATSFSFSQQGGFNNGGNFQMGQRSSRGMMAQSARNGFRPVNGTVISSDANSITVQLQDGSSRIILVSDKTTINKAEAATMADLKNGEKVAVFGTTNTDGSVTAQNIQLNPIMRAQQGGQDNKAGGPPPQQ